MKKNIKYNFLRRTIGLLTALMLCIGIVKVDIASTIVPPNPLDVENSYEDL